MTNIFEYSNIFYTNIYSDIRFLSIFLIRIYSDIRSYNFLDTNIFGYSFVSKSIRMSHSGLYHLWNDIKGFRSCATPGTTGSQKVDKVYIDMII